MVTATARYHSSYYTAQSHVLRLLVLPLLLLSVNADSVRLSPQHSLHVYLLLLLIFLRLLVLLSFCKHNYQGGLLRPGVGWR